MPVSNTPVRRSSSSRSLTTKRVARWGQSLSRYLSRLGRSVQCDSYGQIEVISSMSEFRYRAREVARHLNDAHIANFAARIPFATIVATIKSRWGVTLSFCSECNGWKLRDTYRLGGPVHNVSLIRQWNEAEQFGVCPNCIQNRPVCDECGVRHSSSDSDAIITTDRRRFCSARCARSAGYHLNIHDEWILQYPFISAWNSYHGQQIGRIGPRDMGTEIEVCFETHPENSTEAKEAFAKSLRREFPATVVHCKDDSTVDLEIVTGYGRLQEIEPVVHKTCELARNAGFVAHNTDRAGQHIGLKRPDNPLALAQFVYFFNHTRNSKWIIQFYRRWTHASWSKVDPHKATASYIGGILDNPGRMYGGSKYDIVNLKHDKHIELRCPKGTIRPESILARMALTEAIMDYCDHPRRIEDLAWPAVHRWIFHGRVKRANPVRSKWLSEYLSFRQLTFRKNKLYRNSRVVAE